MTDSPPNILQRFTAALRRNGLLRAGLGITLVMFLAALAAPLLARYNPVDLDLDHILNAPGFPYLFGTDDLGRDVFSRMLYGARVSLWVGFVAVGISVCIGTVLGLVAGWFRGWVDECVMRFVDVMLCFPSFFLILAVIAFLEPSLLNIMIVIGLTSWPGTARLVRAETLSLRERAYVDAARLAGAHAAHSFPAYPARRSAAHFGFRHLGHCRIDSGGIRPFVPGHRHSAPHAELGQYPDPRQRQPGSGLVALRLPRHSHSGHGAWL